MAVPVSVTGVGVEAGPVAGVESTGTDATVGGMLSLVMTTGTVVSEVVRLIVVETTVGGMPGTDVISVCAVVAGGGATPVPQSVTVSVTVTRSSVTYSVSVTASKWDY